MSNSVNQAFAQVFESYVHHLGQQRMSRLRGTVRIKQGTGESMHFERLGFAEMVARGPRNDADTPVLDLAHSKRVAVASDFSWGEAIDPSDAARTLTNPQSEYIRSGAAAWGRQMDRVILEALNDNARTGIGGGGATVALPGSQQIGGATSAMTLDLLRESKRKLDEAEVGDPGTTRYAVVNAAAMEQLLRVTEIASYDYNTVKALVQGEIDTFLGFKFIRTEIMNEVALRPGVDRAYCWFYDSSAVGLFLPKELFTRVGEDPSKSFMTRVYFETLLGAVRIEEAGVVRCEILNTA